MDVTERRWPANGTASRSLSARRGGCHRHVMAVESEGLRSVTPAASIRSREQHPPRFRPAICRDIANAAGGQSGGASLRRPSRRSGARRIKVDNIRGNILDRAPRRAARIPGGVVPFRRRASRWAAHLRRPQYDAVDLSRRGIADKRPAERRRAPRSASDRLDRRCHRRLPGHAKTRVPQRKSPGLGREWRGGRARPCPQRVLGSLRAALDVG